MTLQYFSTGQYAQQPHDLENKSYELIFTVTPNKSIETPIIFGLNVPFILPKFLAYE